MKKILGFYVSRTMPEPIIKTELIPGNDEALIAFDKLQKKYAEAQKRQKHPEKGPNDYMRGLLCAMDIIKEVTAV